MEHVGVLDVDTGSGWSAFAAAEIVKGEVDVVGVDLSEEALREAHHRSIAGTLQ